MCLTGEAAPQKTDTAQPNKSASADVQKAAKVDAQKAFRVPSHKAVMSKSVRSKRRVEEEGKPAHVLGSYVGAH